MLYVVPLSQGTACLGQESEAPRIARVDIGFDGKYKLGQWTPVRVTFQGGSNNVQGRMILQTVDGDGAPCRFHSGLPGGDVFGRRPLLLPAGEKTVAEGYVKFGRVDADLQISLFEGNRRVADKILRPLVDGFDNIDTIPSALLSTQTLVVGLGPPIRFRVVQQPSFQASFFTTEAAYLNDAAKLESLPTRWYGYESVDALVVSTSDPSLYRSLADNQRMDALQEWVRLGGKLVLCVGSQADEILRPDAPFTRFLPGKYERSISLGRRTTVLEDYADSKVSLDWGDLRARGVEVPLIKENRGRIEAFEGNNPKDLPLIIRAPYGFGEVVFFAFDLDRGPFPDWPGRTRLLRKLLGNIPIADEAELTTSAAASNQAQAGFTDLTGQLRAILDQYTDVRPVSFSFVALLVTIYLLLIGPIDYLLVKKVFKRTEFTWITFPTFVVLFSVLAYFLAYHFKGNQLRMNQVDVVDLDAESGELRGTTWFSIFSPRPETYGLTAQPSAKITGGAGLGSPAALTSWFGLPGSGYGGMATIADPAVAYRSYDILPQQGRMEEVPIEVWSTKSFVSRWNRSFPANIGSELHENMTRLLEGSFRNPFPVSLSECVMIYRGAAYTLGDIEAGQRVRVSRETEFRELETYLTGRVMDYQAQQSQAYDVQKRDIGKLLNVMMFHEAAGGETYTGFAHRYQDYLDLSPLVRLDQAVFYGFGPQTEKANIVLRDGQPFSQPGDQYWSVYRCVFSVAKRSEMKANGSAE